MIEDVQSHDPVTVGFGCWSCCVKEVLFWVLVVVGGVGFWMRFLVVIGFSGVWGCGYIA